jgi:hypothetical protein
MVNYLNDHLQENITPLLDQLHISCIVFLQQFKYLNALCNISRWISFVLQQKRHRYANYFDLVIDGNG